LRKDLYVFCFVVQLLLSSTIYSQADQLPEISRWYNNYDCAISLRFDDNLDSHVEYVIPLLNKYGFKGTFMINPGRNYKKYQDFWENQLPQMGHRWGNHTWHHTGAKNPEEAEFEIGEVSKLIWKLYPNESKLNVFASGGGEEWGGKRWSEALPVYKEIVKKYYLIDLYDGNHPALGLNSDYSLQEVKDKIDEAVSEKKHQAFLFHKIGNKNLIDYARKIITGYNYTFEEEKFSKMIQYLNSRSDRIWVAPLVQILKYQREFKASSLELVKKDSHKIVMRLKIETDPILYDQDLTLILPTPKNIIPVKVLQDEMEVKVIQLTENESISNIEPLDSEIQILYK
jgi:peptidoglycan-N-acetylglucosamine deacetylase